MAETIHIDTSNLSPQPCNIGLTNSAYMAGSRILEVPHNINFTLENNALTIKTGSKIWFPAGINEPTLNIGDAYKGGIISDISYFESKLFYQVRLTEDFSSSYFGSATSDLLICIYYRNEGYGYNYGAGSGYTSGTNSGIPSNGVYYNTDTNLISYYENGSMLRSEISLPFIFAHRTSGTLDIVYKTFDGATYCGNHVVIDKIKTLHAPGINSNATYKNVIQQKEHLDVVDVSSGYGTNTFNLAYWTPDVVTYSEVIPCSRCYSVLDTKIAYSSDSYNYCFVEKENATYYSSNSGSSWTLITSPVFVASVILNSGKISNINVNVPNGINFYSTSEIANIGMPSYKYISLTLGASTTTYKAPANGYFTILGNASSTPSTANPIWISFSNGTCNIRDTNIVNNSTGLYIPVKKGDGMYLEYSNFTIDVWYGYFRFVYAEGDM